MNYKTILACAAFLTGMVFFNGHLNAAVESDVVGYQNITVKPGFNMIALNFQPLTGEDVSIQDFVADKDVLVAGIDTSNSDSIQVWNPEKGEFTVYYYRAKREIFPVWDKGPAWVKVGDADNLTEDTIPVGSGIWFSRPSVVTEDANITLSGKIGIESKSHTINPGFNMISSAFPADMPLNNGPIDWVASGAVAGVDAGNSDSIQVWDPETDTFTVYYYRAKREIFPVWDKGPAWVKVGDADNVTADIIPAGKGFWYSRPSTSSAGELTEKSPLAQ